MVLLQGFRGFRICVFFSLEGFGCLVLGPRSSSYEVQVRARSPNCKQYKGLDYSILGFAPRPSVVHTMKT